MQKKSDKSKNVFSRLMRDDKFIDEILKTQDGVDLIDKFGSYGVDLSQIEFSELCKILTQKIQVNSQTYEVDTIVNPISPDCRSTMDKTIVKFEEVSDKKSACDKG